MYRAVKAAKPRARVGISPFGIWRPGVPPTTKAELDAYGATLRRLAQMARARLGRLSRTAALLEHRAGEAELSRPPRLVARAEQRQTGLARDRDGTNRTEAAGARDHRANRTDSPRHFVAWPHSLEHESAAAKPGRDRRFAQGRPIRGESGIAAKVAQASSLPARNELASWKLALP